MYSLSYRSPQLRVAVIARTHYREVQTKAERNNLHVIEQKVLRHNRPHGRLHILSQHSPPANRAKLDGHSLHGHMITS